MKGYLQFLILWILSKKNLKGAEVGRELEKRRGTKPSPGTIYPALKELKNEGLISIDDQKVYSLTDTGQKVLKSSCKSFCKTFYDAEEMSDFCKENKNKL